MSDTKPQPKKPFSEPHLVVYGDIQEVTQAIGKVGAADGGTKANKTKTR
jgi:hypothetical protein